MVKLKCKSEVALHSKIYKTSKAGRTQTTIHNHKFLNDNSKPVVHDCPNFYPTTKNPNQTNSPTNLIPPIDQSRKIARVLPSRKKHMFDIFEGCSDKKLTMPQCLSLY